MCSLIPVLPTRTRLVLFIHHREDRKTTNTGRLAATCLPNSEVIVRGATPEPTPPFAPDPAYQTVLLFPDVGARPLAAFAGLEKPVRLLVPDGTWRQASKVRTRVGGLQDIPCVSLPEGKVTRYRLRSETRDGGLATAEAIARALGVLEGPAVQQALEHTLDIMVGRTLWARGAVSEKDVPGGIPAGAVRHDPRSGVTR